MFEANWQMEEFDGKYEGTCFQAVEGQTGLRTISRDSPDGRFEDGKVRNVVLAALVPCLFSSLRGEDKGAGFSTQDNPARMQRDVQVATAQAGSKYDAYPNLQSLDARATITLADIKGPAQINTIHTTQMRSYDETARSVILEVYFDGRESSAVSVPLGDFFADGIGLGN